MAECTIQLPDGVFPLSTYYIYLTKGCNLACKHCWLAPAYQVNGGSGGHLDYDLFALAIEEGLPLGLKNVKLTGGEPFLHPEIIRIIDFLKDNNLAMSIETNGTLITPSLARHLKEKSTLNFISVSMDGATSETHDNFRGVRGSFRKACQSIRMLVDVGFKPQIIMSLFQGNISEIEALVNLAQELGAGSVKFNMIQSSGRGEELLKNSPDLEQKKLVEIGSWIEKDLQKQVPIHLIYSWPMAFYSLDRLMASGGNSCNIKNILGILSSGHLALCGIGTQEPDLTYGKIGENSIKEIWASHPKLVDLRINLPLGLQGICGECILNDRCLGACVASNYHKNKDLSAPNWFCEGADEMGLFPNTRKRRVS